MGRLVLRVSTMVYLLFQFSVLRSFRALQCILLMYVTSYRSLTEVQFIRGLRITFILCVLLNLVVQCVVHKLVNFLYKICSYCNIFYAFAVINLCCVYTC